VCCSIGEWYEKVSTDQIVPRGQARGFEIFEMVDGEITFTYRYLYRRVY
jgi:hypothetical protein